jgi:hypothetical protein
MYHDMNGWGWFGMTSGTLLFVVLIGVAVYIAIRLAVRDKQRL